MKRGLGLSLTRSRRLSGWAGAWTPADLPGLAAWWPTSALYCFSDAGGAAPCGDADPIYTQTDRSGNARTLAQPTLAYRPIFYAVSGPVGVATYDGIDDCLSPGDVEIVTGNKLTVFALFRCDPGGMPRYAPFVNKQFNTFCYNLGSNWTAADSRVSFNAAGNNHAVSDDPLDDGAYHAAVGVYDGDLGSANTRLYIDGVLQATTADQTGSLPNTADVMALGSSGAGDPGSVFYGGDLGDTGLYAAALTPAEVSRLTTYLLSLV